MYIVKGWLNGGTINDFGDLVEYHKEYRTRHKFICRLFIFYARLFYDWVEVSEE